MKLLTNARKATAALGGAAMEAVSLGLLHGTAERWVTGSLSVVTAALVYWVENVPAPVAIVPPTTGQVQK